MDERARIALLARLLAEASDTATEAGIQVGIGDDAAVLSASRAMSRLVWTIDEQVEGVHFRRALASFPDIGWRSFMAAASDVAAMGAVPWCALSAWVLPGDVDDAAFEGIAHGQRDAARTVGAPIVGGNLSRGPALSLATTLLGTCERALERRGARPGDGVWVAGSIGWAAAGLLALTRGLGEEGPFARAVAAWRRPRALIAEGRAMVAVAHAAVDVSDGLARDADHLAAASGACVVLDEAALRADLGLAEVCAALGVDALGLVLHGGEDYALLATSSLPIPGFRRIGEVRAGTGLVLRAGGGERELEPLGYDHFAPETPHGKGERDP